MVLADLIRELRHDGIGVAPHHIRHAIAAGHIGRPRLDGSLRYVFTTEHLDALRRYFQAKQQRVTTNHD